MPKRKRFSASQKAQIALEILKEEKTVNQIASEFGVHPNLLYRWKKQALENLGKRAAILAASRRIRQLSRSLDHPIRILELGCGEGQVMGALLKAPAQLCAVSTSVGVDYNRQSLLRCRGDYAGPQWIEADFTDPGLLASLGKFEVVLLVNALHEVFSDGISRDPGETDISLAKQRVEQALAGAAGCLSAGGWLVLFDGLEAPGDPQELLRIRFHDRQSRQDFETFAREYQPFQITYRPLDHPLVVLISRRDFTRYITKSIFLGKALWQTEQLQSYQYFSEAEFRAAISRRGLEICEMQTLTMNDEKWRRLVEIETPGADFPEEHILILARELGLSP